MTAKQLMGILVFLGTLGSVIAFFGYIKQFFSWCWQWLKQPWGSKVQRINFAIIADQSQCHWQEGRRGGTPHMVVICGLRVTNSGPTPQGQIVDAYLKKPRTPVRNYMNPDVFFPNGFAREVGFNFEVAPPVVESGETFVADVVIVDQFGGEHTAKGVTFAPSGAHVWDQLRIASNDV